MKNTETIGVFFGGQSPEHDVSIITGQLVINTLKKMGKKVLPVYISKKGQWFVDENLSTLSAFQDLKKFEKESGWNWNIAESKGTMILEKKSILKKEQVTIDLAFPAFHGRFGEDGCFQGIFELCQIPYAGPSLAGAALTMDKAFTKEYYRSHNIPTTDFVVLYAHEWEKSQNLWLEKIEKEIKFPAFVKPARLGSSIGISCAKDKKELEDAIDVAVHYDTKVVIEKAVPNMVDLTCAYLSGDGEQPRVSLVQESVFSSDLFSYEDKYLSDGGAQTGNAEEKLIIPASIGEEENKHVQELTKHIGETMGLTGNCRVDFLYDREAKKLYANEINTIPGTMYHHLWKKSGLTLEEVLERMIQIAEWQQVQNDKLTSVFESSILQSASGMKLAK
jgi:D-alanine-D-alanine ligase